MCLTSIHKHAPLYVSVIHKHAPLYVSVIHKHAPLYVSVTHKHAPLYVSAPALTATAEPRQQSALALRLLFPGASAPPAAPCAPVSS